MRKFAFVLAALSLSGCAYNMTLMPRDSGKIYTGTMNGDGTGNGTMTMAMDGVTCTGPVARVASNQTFGFSNAFGSTNRGATASSFGTTVTSGDAFVKAIMSCSDGRGLRCDMSGRGASGGGICVDDSGRVFDAIAARK
jgi:hypothetical protein